MGWTYTHKKNVRSRCKKTQTLCSIQFSSYCSFIGVSIAPQQPVESLTLSIQSIFFGSWQKVSTMWKCKLHGLWSQALRNAQNDLGPVTHANDAHVLLHALARNHFKTVSKGQVVCCSGNASERFKFLLRWKQNYIPLNLSTGQKMYKNTICKFFWCADPSLTNFLTNIFE